MEQRNCPVRVLGLPVQIDEIAIIKPDKPALFAYPNPFNSMVRIAIDAPLETNQKIEIYDLTGRRVKIISKEIVIRSETTDQIHEIIWAPASSITSGVYLIRAHLNGQLITKRVVYIK